LIICCISIVICGKRTPLLALMAGFLFPAALFFLGRMKERSMTGLQLFVVAGYSLVVAVFCLQLYQKINVGDSAITANLNPRYAEVIGPIGMLAGLTGLDPSTSERLAKLVLTGSLILENPFGTGFWTSVNLFNFYPDSTAQFMLENGVFVSFVSLVMISKLWKRTGIARELGSPQLRLRAEILQTQIFIMVAISPAVNVIYAFKLLAFVFIFYSYFQAQYLREFRGFMRSRAT
jgi:hypothetical protein